MKSWNDQIRDLQNSTEAVRQKAYEYIEASDYFADTKEYAESIICTQDEHEYKWALTLERDLIQEALEYGYAEVKKGNAEQPNEAKTRKEHTMFYKIHHIETAVGERDTTCKASEWDAYLAKLEADDAIEHYSVEGPFEAETDHIRSLAAHGAQIGYSGPTEGQTLFLDLTEDFYTEHLAWIRNQPAVTALTFDLYLPGIEEALAFTIWEDGHIDSGSKENMQRVLDR